VTRVHFVAHSLGNLVIRRYLAGCERQENGFRPEPRMGRIVMLGPPNQGAHLAKLFQDNPAVRWIGGDSIRDLAQRQQWLRENLATPRGEFGILAGCVAESIGGNRLLEGDDDLVVSVEETKLAGASDFAVLPVVHTVLMDDPRARERTLRFLQRGYFVSPDRRQPLLPGPTPDDRSREGGEADP
jgi:hypothetical protein